MKNITSEDPAKRFPPGVCIVDSLPSEPLGSISFPDNRSKALLPPVVNAQLKNNKKVLAIKAVVFIAKGQNTLDFSIYQNCYVDIDGVPQLQFFVAYDMTEYEGIDFDMYEVSFDANPIPFVDHFSQIKTIQTFLWDIDPITSRGTETNVQEN
ncbi:hypothetical protein GON26_18505 [Flavobacterium sp. GA093]|uniref:Uncharacterized protein n=1 Tax=Flavobacterium hydrocarbonoxydans TaxID=2683249 RepID=A0A6I4NX89_9FLAO|nr:hypothetical protein [Flavobacterium hydrocarbonoxydans]MWB96359.1 hypothetical protein [Flavobacterium hydrocarbonoxydans]